MAMSRGTQNQDLADWLQRLGCPMQLAPDDLQRLNTPSMRSVWRHLQAHVMPVQSVQTIRKNLLLSKLKKLNIMPGTFGQFQIQSVKEFSQLKDISDAQVEINTLKDEMKAMDEKLRSTICDLLEKIVKKESMKHDIRDIEAKTSILKLKLSHVQKDVERLDLEMRTAKCLKPCQTQLSYAESNNMKSAVAKYVKECKFSSFTTIDYDYISEMVISTLEFPATAVFDGILLASNDALKSLNSIRAKLDVSAYVSGLSAKLASNGVLPFSKHLSNLNALVIQNEVFIHNCLEKIRVHSAELEKDKSMLVKLMEEKGVVNTSSVDDYVGSEMEFVNTIVENCIKLKELEAMIELRGELEAECSEFDYLKWMVGSLGEKENGLRQEVDKKVLSVNVLICLICNSKVNAVRADVFKKCTEEAFNFFAQLKPQHEENAFLASENIIRKEIEMFQTGPLIAFSRQWEDSYELLPKDLVHEASKNPSLLCLLLQSGPENILKCVLEKICS